MKKNILITALSFWLINSMSLMADIGSVRLIGAGNYFELLRTSAAERPSVRISQVAGAAQNISVNPQSYRGQLQVVDQPLPVEVEIKFNTYNSGQPFTIVIEKVSEALERLACQGALMATVKASIKGRAGAGQKICVPISYTTLPAADSPILTGDFNNVAFFVGPLGVNDKYDPDDVKSLPFRFGLMGWTSLTPPWNNKSLNATFDESKYSFSKPADVLQGFAALGGGIMPRAYHGSINNIYNDTDHIIILSRESSIKELAQYNMSQIIPPHSILPYTLMWVPKVGSKNELALPGHSGIRIAALKIAARSRTPDTISHSEIEEMGPNTIINIPKGLADLEKLIASSTLPITNDAADLLGVTLWNKDMKSAYNDFDAASHYYAISTESGEKATYLQKCSVKTNMCDTANTLTSPLAFDDTKNGLPTYYNIIIKDSPEDPSSFEMNVYPTTVKPPRAR